MRPVVTRRTFNGVRGTTLFAENARVSYFTFPRHDDRRLIIKLILYNTYVPKVVPYIVPGSGAALTAVSLELY